LKGVHVAGPVADETKDDGYEFTPPDFDEDTFIHRELVSFKTTSILFVWGIVAAAASWGAFVAVGGTDLGWFLGLALCAAFGYALKFLYPRLGADIAHFKRKEWVGTGFLFFFTWLSFFVLAINPPITDIAAPEVFVYGAPPVQEPGGNATFHVLATDNVAVQSLDIRVTRDGAALNVPLRRTGTDTAEGTLPGAAGRYTITATATDAKGHAGHRTANVTVGPALDVTWPHDNALAAPTDQVFVRVPGYHACAENYKDGSFDCIRSVVLRRDDGTEIVLAPSKVGDEAGWSAFAADAGWRSGNNTVTAVAKFPQHFLGSHPVPGGEATKGPVTLRVLGATGTQANPVQPEPTQRAVLVPGPSAGLLAAAILGLALLLRRRAN
jgi:hypothetical protein